MRNPDGYHRRSATVVWKGTTAKGHPAYGTKIDYSGQNTFGGTVRQCEFVFFFRNGDSIKWDDAFGREPCDAIQFFSGGEPELVAVMSKRLAEQ